MILLFENFSNRLEISGFLRKFSITDFVINDDLTVDVNESVYICEAGLFELPIKFRNINGSFYIHDNKLTTLKGCPEYVSGDFGCGRNNLTTLEYSPKYVGMDFDCSNNEITSLDYMPKEIGEGFFCRYNKLTSLKGISKNIRNIYVSDNFLKTTKYFPTDYDIFEYYNNQDLPIEILHLNPIIKRKYLFIYQDEYGIWNSDGTFNKKRFNLFSEDYDNGSIK